MQRVWLSMMPWRRPKRSKGLPIPVARLAPLLAIVLPVTLGCGPQSDRLPISGKITLDGQPLDDGSIRFTSLGEKKFSTGAMVQNGEYHIPQEKGLPPGTYHLEITAPDSDAPPIMVSAGPGQAGTPTAPERVPAAYNVNSDKKVDVSADRDNQFDFDIASKPK